MGKTSIEWADKSLNFYTWSCNKVSEGCKHCYMMTMANRFGKPDPNGTPQWRESAMKEYKALQSGDVVFVNSMSDTYHPGVPFEWIERIHNLADARPDVIFLMLTKRPERLLELSDRLVFPDNLFVGTSIELPKYIAPRLEALFAVPAMGHFVSLEPLLGSLFPEWETFFNHVVDRMWLDWVIVGAESGDNRRAFDIDWARELRDWCTEHRIPFMYKQGSHRKSGQNRLLDGREWNETPHFEDHLLKVRS